MEFPVKKAPFLTGKKRRFLEAKSDVFRRDFTPCQSKAGNKRQGEK